MDAWGCVDSLIYHIDQDLDSKHLSATRVSEDLASNYDVGAPFCNCINRPSLHLGLPVSQVTGDFVSITLPVLGAQFFWVPLLASRTKFQESRSLSTWMIAEP